MNIFVIYFRHESTASCQGKQDTPNIGSVGAEIRRVPQKKQTRMNFPIIRSKTCHMYRKTLTSDVRAEGAGLASDVWRTRHDNTPATEETLFPRRIYPKKLIVSMPNTEDGSERMMTTEYLLNSPDSGLE